MQTGLKQNLCANYTWAFSSTQAMSIFHSVFSPLWEKNILVGLGRKHSGHTNFFFPPPSNQTSTKNIFSPLFSLPFSILPKIFLTKQTLRIVTKKVMVLEQLG